MESALKLIPAFTRLISIEGAGHSLLTKRNKEEVIKLVVDSFLAMVAAVHQS